jgi:hypothetical protein
MPASGPTAGTFATREVKEYRDKHMPLLKHLCESIVEKLTEK